MTRRAATAEPIDELPEIVVFVPGPDGEPLEFPPLVTPAEAIRDLGTSVTASLEALKEFQAPPGPRPGSTGDRPDRRGSREDVVTSLLVDPALAASPAVTARLFVEPLRRLDVDQCLFKVDRQGLSWPAVVRTGWFRKRHATLRLHPSPSSNLTVLELIPDKPRFLRTRAFVRVGVGVLIELGDRIQACSARESLRTRVS